MLRVLHAIDEIIVTPYVSRSPAEVQQCTSIKDAMRDQCVPQLAAFWHQVLVTFYQALPALATLALQNISSVRKVCACVCVFMVYGVYVCVCLGPSEEGLTSRLSISSGLISI